MKEGFLIGELAHEVGISAQTIRYYEKLGLIDAPQRTDARYRIYTREDETRLRFILQAKQFGLSLEEIKQIIDLRSEGAMPCTHVQKMMQDHLNDLNQRIQELIQFRDQLASRFEWFKMLNPVHRKGEICGFIEMECRCGESEA